MLECMAILNLIDISLTDFKFLAGDILSTLMKSVEFIKNCIPKGTLSHILI